LKAAREANALLAGDGASEGGAEFVEFVLYFGLDFRSAH
jgi:hypothetical protein